ncbi:TonB-dependent receptor [Myroides marinus]|uniref:Outer membrane receptor proteins, mostly Fe transport n=1 Tax=Myroides marinus TaxID=703342 RepID=A0A1H6WUU7_9FLAO|nr:outer membrane beta-barrel family protein [Myroides marinus]KUF43839.1 TonB-dependent receptor [Myroides marinus]MDM1348540.1 TonB-dependent receptor [Myroides marinus]MDM1352043.1 TonB-dependent receptor [Myroides marinus]MDM1355651.1 TonB-dependent receptor [Myroides marinus]MDM1359281.1 TonB-dependent receptor [Myroides marinus]
MGRIIILLCALLFGALTQAQSISSTIKGKVVDNKKELLAFVTVVAKDAQGNVLQSMYTDEQGNYEITNTETQQLEFTYIGFKSKVVTVGKEEVSVVELLEDNAILDEVVIKAKRPTIKREIDRLVFNVQDTPLATTNAWDIIKQTPGVTSIGDNLSIRGSQSILVTINDKKVMLTGDQLKDMLEGTDGTQVEAVEVITNPPAKYEAQGNAVLNIKLKKNVNLGYKGSVTDRYKQATYAVNTLSTQHSYTGEKINLSGSYSFTNGTSARYNEDNVIYENGERWSTDLTRINKYRGRHSFQSELDVKIDSTLTLTIGGNGYINEQTKGDFVIPTLIYNKDNNVESNYTTFNKKRANMETYTGYLMLDKKFSTDKKLLWSSYFTYEYQEDNQDVLTHLNFKGKPKEERFFATENNQHTRLAVSGLDYSVDKETIKWELGGKYSIVKAQYGLDFFDYKLDGLNKDKSNIFDYQEINWAGYTSFTKNWDKWQVKGGLRGEYTGIQTKSNGDNNTQSYFKLFPTAYVKYDVTEDQHLTLSYGKRIDRPSYSWMNPAKSYYNLFSYFQGDPDLKPMISHNFSLGYDYKEWSIEAVYKREINPSMEISYQEDDTNTLIYHYTNIDKRQQVGIVLNTPYKIGEWLVLNSYLTAGYQEDYFYGVDNKLYKNDVFGIYGRLFASVDLHKKSNWKVMMTYSYSSPSVQGTFRISSYQRTDFIMSRDFLQKKISANLYVYNIFGSDRQIISTNYANQNNYFKDYSDTQGFAISVKYNFGNQKAKYSSKEIDMAEKDRL